MDSYIEIYSRFIYHGLLYFAWLVLAYKTLAEISLMPRVIFFSIGFLFILVLTLDEGGNWIYFGGFAICFGLLCSLDYLVMRFSYKAEKMFLKDLGLAVKNYPLWFSLIIHGAFVCLAFSWT
jgi:hypothetical protein